MAHQNAHYDKFFDAGGWRYDLRWEKFFLLNRIIPLAQWKRQEQVLDVGAGMGHHSELLRQLGLRVTAVEASDSAVSYMRRHYPMIRAVLADLSKWSPEGPVDHIFARGMSFFHYELEGTNVRGINVPSETQRMFQWLRPGGTFVLQIATDFSGNKKDIHMNRFEDYVSLFSRFGRVIAHTDWRGRQLPLDPVAADADGIIIVTRNER